MCGDGICIQNWFSTVDSAGIIEFLDNKLEKSHQKNFTKQVWIVFFWCRAKASLRPVCIGFWKKKFSGWCIDVNLDRLTVSHGLMMEKWKASRIRRKFFANKNWFEFYCTISAHHLWLSRMVIYSAEANIEFRVGIFFKRKISESDLN